MYDVRVYPCTPKVVQLIKNGLAPMRQSLRLNCPARTPLRLFPPKAGSKRPQCKPHPTPRRRKRLWTSPSEEGESNLFHRLGVGCPGSGMNIEDAPGRVFLVNWTRFPKLLLQSRRLAEGTAPLLPTPLPNLGKTQREIAW